MGAVIRITLGMVLGILLAMVAAGVIFLDTVTAVALVLVLVLAMVTAGVRATVLAISGVAAGVAALALVLVPTRVMVMGIIPALKLGKVNNERLRVFPK